MKGKKTYKKEQKHTSIIQKPIKLSLRPKYRFKHGVPIIVIFQVHITHKLYPPLNLITVRF